MAKELSGFAGKNLVGKDKEKFSTLRSSFALNLNNSYETIKEINT